MEINKNQKYIVRCDRSGVFFGNIEYQKDREVQLKNARCLWYWDGAASLLQLAKEGTKAEANCKFTVFVDEITVLDAIEIIPCTNVAIASIEGAREWKI